MHSTGRAVNRGGERTRGGAVEDGRLVPETIQEAPEGPRKPRINRGVEDGQDGTGGLARRFVWYRR
jgi:hypothetical protein